MSRRRRLPQAGSLVKLASFGLGKYAYYYWPMQQPLFNKVKAEGTRGGQTQKQPQTNG